MDISDQPSICAALVVLLTMLSACTSNELAPDPDQLIRSDDCAIANGKYRTDLETDQNILAGSIFGTVDSVGTLEVEKTESGVFFIGETDDGQLLKRDIPERFSCNSSVLTVVLDDQGVSGAMVSSASDTKLELYARDETSITLRFIESELTFIIFIPVYQSQDHEVVLQRTIDSSAKQ